MNEEKKEVNEFEKKQPVKVVRSGKVVFSVWKNTNQDGKVFYSTTIKKNYKKNDEWKTTQSFSRNDLPDISFCSQEVFTFIGGE